MPSDHKTIFIFFSKLIPTHTCGDLFLFQTHRLIAYYDQVRIFYRILAFDTEATWGKTSVKSFVIRTFKGTWLLDKIPSPHSHKIGGIYVHSPSSEPPYLGEKRYTPHYVTVVSKSWNIILVSHNIPRTEICWILPSVRRENFT